jgi:hypothetical protein
MSAQVRRLTLTHRLHRALGRNLVVRSRQSLMPLRPF